MSVKTSNMAIGIGDELDFNKEVVSSNRIELAVVRCACNYRHGTVVADTKFMSWRCKSCKMNNATSVEGGRMTNHMSDKREITLQSHISFSKRGKT